jgi:hypothetical protein
VTTIYRDVLAEVRRPYGEAPWRLTGVVIEGRWRPIAPGVRPPSMRAIEAGCVDVIRLPRFIANDDADAVAAAVCVADMQGIEMAGPEAGPRWHEVSV